MIRVAFCIGGYPPEEFKRRADLALSYANAKFKSASSTSRLRPIFTA